MRGATRSGTGLARTSHTTRTTTWFRTTSRRPGQHSSTRRSGSRTAGHRYRLNPTITKFTRARRLTPTGTDIATEAQRHGEPMPRLVSQRLSVSAATRCSLHEDGTVQGHEEQMFFVILRDGGTVRLDAESN